VFVVIDDVNNYVNNYMKNDVMRCLELLFAVLPQTLCGHIVVCVCVCVCVCVLVLFSGMRSAAIFISHLYLELPLQQSMIPGLV
jgi:hypothetical protein